MKKYFQSNEAILFVILIVFCIFLSFYNPQFYGIQNINSILRSSSTVMIVAFGMTILLTSGEVDLSVGALLSFVTVIVMDVINISGSIFLGFSAVFVFCLLIGLINGLVRTVLNVNSLIATLEQILIGKAQTLHGCYIHPKSEHIRISRELNAVANKRVPLSNGILWDNRWKLECPDTQIGSFCHVAALGLTGARWVRERTDTLIPYKSLQSHPGIYDESGLRCAPSLIANSQIVATFCAIPFHYV